MVTKPIQVLERAISDGSRWRWWIAEFPLGMQVEFDMVQLWLEPPAPDRPPPGVVSLRLTDLKAAAFLGEPGFWAEHPNWPEELAQDKFQPPTLNPGSVHFCRSGDLRTIFPQVAHRDWRVGSAESFAAQEFGPDGVGVLLWTGQVGVAAVCGDLTLLSHAGPLELDEVPARYERWWQYHAEYHRRRGTDDPMPEDVLCEINVPANQMLSVLERKHEPWAKGILAFLKGKLEG